VTLVTDSEGGWSLVGTTADNLGTLNSLNSDSDEHRIDWEDITIQ
jgi:hypothetical protein